EGGEAIYLSDGHINLAILPARQRREGIYHFGMEVEDVKEAAQTALAAGATGGKAELPKDGRFAETFVLDPVGTRVDLSRGWKVQPVFSPARQSSHNLRREFREVP